MRAPLLFSSLKFCLPSLFAAASGISAAQMPAVQADPAATAAHQAMDALAAKVHESSLEEDPIDATSEGDHRFDDQLVDLSPAAIARRRALPAAWLKELQSIDPSHLGLEDHLTYEILRRQFEDSIAVNRLLPADFSRYDEPIFVTQMGSPPQELSQVIRITPFATVANYQNYLSRLEKYPHYLEQQVAQLKRGIAAGYTAPKVVLAPVPAQYDLVLDPDPEKNPALAPFLHFPAGISTEDQARLRDAAVHVVREKLIPAFAAQLAFFRDVYMPHARETIAASSLPAGRAYYQLALHLSTTNQLTPEQINQTGRTEVARIEKEMDETMKGSGFQGTRDEFVEYLNSDPKFFFKTPDDLVNSYRATGKRIDAELPKLFAELPRTPYGVRPMLPEEGENSEYYSQGALDGSRAGYVNVNTNDLKSRPNWEMETLTLHEGVPGHHLQVSRAIEARQLSDFRRSYWNSAYGEGWALYAEWLGYEIGFYKDPYMHYGHLSDEILRASRMVVDTGMHAMGMSRAEAVAYMRAHTPLPHAMIDAEIDRYIVWPGQAVAYKVGELDILALRHHAEERLGARFDERRFHNALIDHGALPLDLLDETINAWIEQQAALPAASSASAVS